MVQRVRARALCPARKKTIHNIYNRTRIVLAGKHEQHYYDVWAVGLNPIWYSIIIRIILLKSPSAIDPAQRISARPYTQNKSQLLHIILIMQSYISHQAPSSSLPQRRFGYMYYYNLYVPVNCNTYYNNIIPTRVLYTNNRVG